jgi:hypothetical protein
MEQTFKFPPHLLKTIDNAQNDGSEVGEAGEAGEANGSDSSKITQLHQVEWHEDAPSGGFKVGILDILDTEQDKEAKEMLLDSPTTASTGARLLQNPRLLQNLFS